MSPELAKTLIPLLRSPAFKIAVVRAWANSKPNGVTKDKNERAFWADSRNKHVKVGRIFAGAGSSVPYQAVISNWNRENVLFHTHPFLKSEGYRYQFSPDDLAVYNGLSIVGVMMAADGIYYYDGRQK
jgi:hypothetical protein